jgi:excisionase family DNA binding protein
MIEIANPARPLISVAQAAKLAAVSPTHIYRLVQRGELPAVRVGVAGHGPIRIERERFTSWLFAEEV